jgi:GT2 family glycosyltransferase
MSHTAVVILNFNGEKLLQQFLPSVIAHSKEAEVIVVDNGSADNSVRMLREQFPEVRVIVLDNNYGFCGGYNRALKMISADYFVLLNSDVEVTANWLTPMIRLMDFNPRIGALQPKILSYHNKSVFEYAGAGGGYIDALGYPFCRGRILSTVEEDQHQYDDTLPIFWATGACLMIRSKFYHEFEGLDEDFFAHMEEIDLCWKIQRTGALIFYCGSSTVYHLGAGTLGYNSPRKTYLNFRNGLSLITKHLDTFELMWKLPLRVGLDWVAAAMFLSKGQWQHGVAVAKAHAHYVVSLGKTLKKRYELRKQYRTYPRNTIYPGLVVVSYFLQGKKTFSGFQVSDINNPR